MNNDFFIGWNQTAPRQYARSSRRIVGLFFFLLMVVGGLLVVFQRGFPNSRFELGDLRELEGIAVTTPIPSLLIPVTGDTESSPAYQRVLLIGAGKFSALPALEAMEKEQGRSLKSQTVRLRGTLIYYEGKAAFELTKGKKAFLDWGKPLPEPKPSPPPNAGFIEVTGEILDAKCYLGVMKPGCGKPHRACAVRCLSGGIPPLFQVQSGQGGRQYYLLLDQDGNPINEKILDYVADQVQLCGWVEQHQDWSFLRVDLQKGIRRLNPPQMKETPIPMCN